MSVDVKCHRSKCGKIFATSADAFDAKTTACPDCGKTEFIYMVNEAGDLIHPTEICPTCSGPALLRERCRCAWYCIKCPAGHDWHTCHVHKVQAPGRPHDRDLRLEECTCPQVIA